MTNVGESSQSKKPRVNWKKENVVKTFIVSSLHEISVNGREGGSLKAMSWKNVAETLLKTHNFVVEQRQMKNHYDYLKGNYGAWAKLRNKTGNQNKFVEKLRTAPLPFPELCIQLFDGVASTGIGTWGPTATVPNPSSVTSEAEDYDTQDYYDLTQDPLPSEEDMPFRPLPQRKKLRGNKQSATDNDLAKVVMHVKDILKKPEDDEMNLCIDKLETLGWEQSPLYDVALHIFGQSSDYRKIWLHLNNERCEGWVTGHSGHPVIFSGETFSGETFSDKNPSSPATFDKNPFSDDTFRETFSGKNPSSPTTFRPPRDPSIFRRHDLFFPNSHNHITLPSGSNVGDTDSIGAEVAEADVEGRREVADGKVVGKVTGNGLYMVVRKGAEKVVEKDGGCRKSRQRKWWWPKESSEKMVVVGKSLEMMVVAGKVAGEDVVPSDQQARYRGRGRGDCYQNVLAICDFNMVFTFVWAGWEGIAHDSRVLREVVFNPTSGFLFPPTNKYYLCDAAYTCTRGFMTPYRNTRYWLPDFRRQRALTKKELFNHAHAQLRNVIERAYGVLKARFPILTQMAPYPFQIQKDVMISCFAIHNFIRKCNIQDQLFMEYNENTIFTDDQEQHEGSNEIEVDEMEWSSQDNEYMSNLRN
ncbi:hypothetical protein OSB04_029351 [Centaurea solstitialis]|uniref:Myb/SANT-like domain-containing protein n=1 Tax=Centaurea solstitialis TaxID=347529 RepID=A0AA38SUY0_9ASTR|nr:hypothetical protein OSB04_029351 [Centaurea solstitialis]